MANVPGTFYTAETQRRGTTPVSPPSAVDDPQDPVNPSGPPVVPPVAERYASEAAMIADQLNQKSGYLYFDGTDTWWYKGVANGVIGDYEAFGSGGGGGSSLWTESSGDIYRDSKVTIGQSTIGNAQLFINSSLTESADSDYIQRFVNNSITRHYITSGGYASWRLSPSSGTEYGTIEYQSPNGGSIGGSLGITLRGVSSNGRLDFYMGGTNSGNNVVGLRLSPTGGLAASEPSRGFIFDESSRWGFNSDINANTGFRFRNIGSHTNAFVVIDGAGTGVLMNVLNSGYVFVKNIQTDNFTGTTARQWKLGERKAATTSLDTTQYLTVEVNGVTYNLALATI